MATMWLWVSCGWCGFTGCAAPIGERCPKCLRPLEEPTPTSRADGERSAGSTGSEPPSA
jgi:hypothetical protein